jgi:hypothetical protein
VQIAGVIVLTPPLDEEKEMRELTIELLETLLVIGKRFLDYKKEYNLQIEGMDSLTRLTSKAQTIMEQIGWPYNGTNPIKSRCVTAKDHDDKSPPDKATVYL